jgi:hypothetical protein
LDHRLGSRIQPTLLAPGMWFGRHLPGAPVAAQEFFDKRHTHPKKFGKSTL